MNCLPREFLKTFNKSEDFLNERMLANLNIQDGDTICQPFATTTKLMQINKAKVSNICLNTTYFPLAALLLVVRDDINLLKSETYGYHLDEIEDVKRHYDKLSKEMIDKAKRMKLHHSPDDIKLLGIYYYLINRKSIFDASSLIINDDGYLYTKYNNYKTHLLDKVCSGKELDALHLCAKKNNLTISDLNWKSYCFNVLGSKKGKSKWLFTLPDLEENAKMVKHDTFFKFSEDDFHDLMREVIPIIESREEEYLIIGGYNDGKQLEQILDRYCFVGEIGVRHNRRQLLEIDEVKKIYTIKGKK